MTGMEWVRERSGKLGQRCKGWVGHTYLEDFGFDCEGVGGPGGGFGWI